MPEGKPAFLARPVARRALLGGSLAAAAVAAAYAALGEKLDLFGGDSLPAATLDGGADASALSRESVRVSHLLRRAGFGVTKAEFDRYQSLGLKATINELVHWTEVDDGVAEGLASQIPIEPGIRQAPVVWWLTRMANTKRPLQEKMTLFWHGLLTSQISAVKDPLAMVAQNEFFRAHAFDSFPAILKGIAKDPAMMVYLDIAGSHKRAPNENYARELMELFAMGVGNFSEQDVREAARAFTGWRVPQQFIRKEVFTRLPAVFRPEFFDNGVKTFLGRSGNLYPGDIVDIIVEQPVSAAYITRRLFSFFVYPDPADEELQPFIEVYNKNDRSIGAVVEAMLRSDVFYSARAYRALVKSPLEYAIGAVRALGLQASVGPYLAEGSGPRGGGVLADMGQIPFEPPNVAGWPGGATWLNSATLFARLNLINALTGGGRARGPRAVPQPSLTNLGTAADALAYYLPLALDDNVSDEARQVLLDYAGGADAPLSPEKLRGLVYLILASPQFHLA